MVTLQKYLQFLKTSSPTIQPEMYIMKRQVLPLTKMAMDMRNWKWFRWVYQGRHLKKKAKWFLTRVQIYAIKCTRLKLRKIKVHQVNKWQHELIYQHFKCYYKYIQLIMLKYLLWRHYQINASNNNNLFFMSSCQ